MPIEFDCACGKHLKVPDQYAGKRAKCPACKEVLTVPALTLVKTPEATDEDAAFRALTEGPEPEARDWRSNSAPAYSPPAKPQPNEDEVRRKASDYAARALAAEAPAKKPEAKKKSKPRDEYAMPEKSWNINWGTMLGALAALFGGLLWLGLGYLAGRIYFYPFFLIGAGIFGIIKSLLNRD